VTPPRSLSAPNGGRRCQSCATTLAADNTARLCGRCHREERDQLSAPTQLSDSFFETEEFRAAFESQHIGKVLKAYRSHPRHLRVFGKALNQELLGRWLDLTQAQVSKLENGKPEQNLETLRNYAQILHLPQHLLWFDFPGHGRLRPAGSPASADDGDLHRATATTSEVLTMAADRARRFMTSLQTTSDESLSLIHDDVRDLVRSYPTRPLHEVLGHMVSLQDTVFTLLEQPHRPSHARQLYFLSAVVAGLMAKASHDLADPHAAFAQSRTAWLCAEQADHDGARAWICGLQALVAYWAGRPHDSIHYAQRGATYAARAQNSSLVWLAASEARVWGMLGHTDNARDALQRAENAWNNVRPDEMDEMGGIATFSRPRQLYFAADALAWLPEQISASTEYAEQAVAAYDSPTDPDWAFGDAAGSRASLAIARIHHGQLDGATEIVAPVLDLPPDQRINGIVHSLNRVHRALNNATNPDGLELQQRIEHFARTPLRPR
jgi:hypothetical protein